MGTKFVASHVVLKATSCNVAKQEKTWLDNQHVFIPLAFDTLKFLAMEAVKFMQRVQWIINSNFSTPKDEGLFFVSFCAIQNEITP